MKQAVAAKKQKTLHIAESCFTASYHLSSYVSCFPTFHCMDGFTRSLITNRRYPYHSVNSLD